MKKSAFYSTFSRVFKGNRQARMSASVWDSGNLPNLPFFVLQFLCVFFVRILKSPCLGKKPKVKTKKTNFFSENSPKGLKLSRDPIFLIWDFM